ncbi:hypothetical protein [Arthrobacter sp. JSM 101049]|uniref:hypothetical protein n=1 Tax=Arthrobacter sp. JSM 101049 TaxID=929097 RepID=UPI0035620B4D
MRRSPVVVALLAVLSASLVVALGTGPAVATAPTGLPAGTVQAAATPAPALAISSVSPRHQITKYFTIRGATRTGDRVLLQLRSGTTWTTVSTRILRSPATSTRASYRFKREGSASFRAVLVRAGQTVAATTARAATYRRVATEAWTNAADNRLFTRIGGRIAAGERTTDTVVVFGQFGRRTISLQVLRGTKWTTIARHTTSAPGYGTARFSTPATTATVTRKYRYQVSGTTAERGVTSRVTTVRHMNPRDYRGAVRTAYNYMKGYCPRQVITLSSNPRQDTSYSTYPNMQIELARTLVPGRTMQYIALHECAHIRTFKVYGDSIGSGEKRLDKIYGKGKGVEMLADCMAYRMGADKRFGGSYTTRCTGSRGTAAARVLAGKKA